MFPLDLIPVTDTVAPLYRECIFLLCAGLRNVQARGATLAIVGALIKSAVREPILLERVGSKQATTLRKEFYMFGQFYWCSELAYDCVECIYYDPETDGCEKIDELLSSPCNDS